ncbi:YceD family protein [Allorhizobium undicola]|uniref:YceD family protein n=1 Tax=Allorhizobium undicola TaxID=78527 RepID=UPI000488A4AC|nr:DUF177 domain-containing protein [Allorhizobium undicola]
MTKRDTDTETAFSFPVKVGHISANPVQVHLEADEAECAGLARLWRVLAVKSLKADLKLSRWKRDGVRIKGTVEAEIEQACVVTLEPVASSIREEVEQVFLPEGSKLIRLMTDGQGEMVLDPDGPDIPETFAGDTIDAGLLVSEFAALAIDPYPRKQGVEFSGHSEDTGAEIIRPSPFAALKDWKKD